jgi:NADH-quinone oxidoreductase subunit C
VYQIIPERNEKVISKIAAAFPEEGVQHEYLADMLCFTVDKEIIYDLLLFLKDDRELQFNFLTTLCGMHYPEREELGIVYHLHSFVHNHRIRIKTAVPVATPVIPSVTGIWPAADWMERETFDFFGIEFSGHPNLKRILNEDEMTYFPMRKEYPLEDQTREDKDDSMFGR